MKYIRINLLILILLLWQIAFSQTKTVKFIHVVDTAFQFENSFTQKIYLESDGKYTELFSVVNALEDFKYYCTFCDNFNNQFICFSNYGSAAGITKFYIVEPSSGNVYESKFFAEYETPLIPSFNAADLSLACFVFSTDCGKIEVRFLEKMKKNDLILNKLPESYKVVRIIRY